MTLATGRHGSPSPRRDLPSPHGDSSRPQPVGAGGKVDRRTIYRELGPVERQMGRVMLGSVDCDGVELTDGEVVELLDEGGYCYPAVVTRVEPGRYGQRYWLQFTDPDVTPTE